MTHMGRCEKCWMDGRKPRGYWAVGRREVNRLLSKGEEKRRWRFDISIELETGRRPTGNGQPMPNGARPWLRRLSGDSIFTSIYIYASWHGMLVSSIYPVIIRLFIVSCYWNIQLSVNYINYLLTSRCRRRKICWHCIGQPFSFVPNPWNSGGVPLNFLPFFVQPYLGQVTHTLVKRKCKFNFMSSSF